MSKIRFPEDMPKAPSVADGDKMMLADASTNEAKHITFDQAKQYFTIEGQRIAPVAPGVLPAGPSGQTRYMEVTAVGSWTYGGNTFTNADGYKTTLWWNGTTWSNAGSTKIKGESGIDGKTIQNYSNTTPYTLGSQVFFNGTEIYESISATAAGESPTTHPAKWTLRFRGAEHYQEIERFKELSEGYLVDDNFDNNNNGWAGYTGQVPPFTINNGELSITLDVPNANRSMYLVKNFVAGKVYPVEVRIKRTGAQTRAVIGTNITSSSGATHHIITDLTDDYKVYNFNITPSSTLNTRIMIGVASAHNVGGSIVVDYIKVGTQGLETFNLEGIQALKEVIEDVGNIPDLKLVDFKNSQTSLDLYTKTFDWGIINTIRGGLDYANNFDLGADWVNMLYTPVKFVTNAQIQLFDESYTLVATLPAKTKHNETAVISKVDYPTARFINLFADSDFKNEFVFALSYPKNKHQVDAENAQSDTLKVQGFETNYLDYERDFPNIGAWTIGGVLNATLYPNYRGTNKLVLPDDWFAIEFDAMNAMPLGMCFFGADGLYAHHINHNASGFKRITVYRSDIPEGCKYFAYSRGTIGAEWNRKMYFKMRRKSISLSEIPESYKSKVARSKIFNPDVTDLTIWNERNPTNQINEEIVIEAAQFPERTQVRIPSVVITNAGTVLIASEIRARGGDIGVIDIGLSRKSNSDTSYTSAVVYHDNPATYGRGMNPSLLVDRTGAHGGVAGRIYLCFLTTLEYDKGASLGPRESNNCLIMHSDNDGITWSTPMSLKDKWLPDAKYVGFFPSPHAGIQLTDGTIAYCTMVAVSGSWKSGFMYKKPGQDWVVSSETFRPADNECTIMEYEPNKILINCRVEQPQTWGKRRVYSYNWNKDKWDLHNADLTYSSQSCNCQMAECKMVISGVTYYLRTHIDPYTYYAERRRTTLWVSRDYITWTRQHLLNLPVSHGYSAVAYHNNKIVACYEFGGAETIRVQDLSPMVNEIVNKTRFLLELTQDENNTKRLYNERGW